MMTLDTIMANMTLLEREIIMDKMVKASRDILETIADMGYIDEYETSLTAMEERGYQDELGEMDIDQIQADGYEFGMDLAFGILEENENNPARVLDIQKYVNRQYESCSKKKFMKVLETLVHAMGNDEGFVTDVDATLEAMEIGEMVVLALETLIVSFCMKIMSVIITVIMYGRMIEIYLYTSVAPIPFATMTNREWGQIGTNYFRGLFALAFQAFLMMVCVAIYAVLISTLTASDNLSSALFGVMGYTVILCFSLFKTGSLSKSIFNAH